MTAGIAAAHTPRRYDRREALELLTDLPMGQLMSLAHTERVRRFPGDVVTFVVDTNPNYTNICETGCAFCAFHRKRGDADAYWLTPGQVAEKVKAAADNGATTVLLQGGHHPLVRLRDWQRYIQAIQQTSPQVHIHPFSPAEITFMAAQEGCCVSDVLAVLWDAGIRTLPGGGAEILTESVRTVIAPRKASSDQWLDVCEKAHRIGFKTTATMMYGHVETDADVVTHLFRLRELQDETGGFTSFIPWSFKPGRTPLGQRINHSAHPARYVRVIAAARLVLDNFAHIQSSWFSETVAAGQLGLLAGADDFGGVLLEEQVHKEAGHRRQASVDQVVTLIRRCGFTPARRDSHYRIQETFDPPPPIGSGPPSTVAD